MNFGSILGKITPWISAAATSNVPALIGLAAKAVSGAVGKPVDASLSAITEAVTGATPEQIQAIKQAEDTFQVQMQTLGFQHIEEMEKMAEQDRENARAREIAVKDKYPQILASVFVVGFFSLVIFVLVRPPDPKVETLLTLLLGALVSGVTAIIGYYYGSSAGSDAKTTILGDIAKK
jgi:hypothetical protein